MANRASGLFFASWKERLEEWIRSVKTLLKGRIFKPTVISGSSGRRYWFPSIELMFNRKVSCFYCRRVGKKVSEVTRSSTFHHLKKFWSHNLCEERERERTGEAGSTSEWRERERERDESAWHRKHVLRTVCSLLKRWKKGPEKEDHPHKVNLQF